MKCARFDWGCSRVAGVGRRRRERAPGPGRRMRPILFFTLVLSLAAAPAAGLPPEGISSADWVAALEQIPAEERSLLHDSYYVTPPEGGCPASPVQPKRNGSPSRLELEELLESFEPPRCGLVITTDHNPAPHAHALWHYQLEKRDGRWKIISSRQGWISGCG